MQAPRDVKICGSNPSVLRQQPSRLLGWLVAKHKHNTCGWSVVQLVKVGVTGKKPPAGMACRLRCNCHCRSNQQQVAETLYGTLCTLRA
jgi:hypothetical protein